MKKHFLQTQTFILIITFSFTYACNGQVTSNQPKERRNELAGQPKLIKSHFSNPYKAAADNVHCGLQDKAGNLWFGTTGDGAYRYDGKSFINYTIDDGLSSNTVYSILEDNDGNIWIGTANGICRYDGKKISPILTSNSNFSSIAALNKTSSEEMEVYSIMQDKSGIIWFGTTEGVYCYNGNSFSRFLDNSNIINKDGLSLKSIQCMLQDRNGNIWFGSGPMALEGICLYDGISITNFKPKKEEWIRNILEDKKGNIWFSNRHYGICIYNGNTFTQFAEKEAFNKTGTGSVLEDKNGTIWFSSLGKEEDEGIWTFDGKSFKNLTKKDGLNNTSVWCLVEDRNGNIWVGTRNTGLYRYDGKTFIRFSE